MATQQPVIPPVAVEEFTCAGNGLLYEEHPRESPAELRMLLLPQGDKNGISDRDRKVYTIECIFHSLISLYTYRLYSPDLTSTWNRPKAWWLAQNKFYGLAQAKSTPINILRSKLEDALRVPDGMRVTEKILNLESEGNRKYRDLSQLVLQETQAAKKGTIKAAKSANPTSAPVPAGPKPKTAAVANPKAAASSSKGKGPVKPAPARKATAKASAAPATGASSSSNTGPGYAPKPPVGQTKTTARKITGRQLPPKTKQDPDPQTKVTARTTTGSKGPPKLPKIEQDGFEILDDFDDFARELPPLKPTTKTYASKSTGGLAPRKRERSPEDAKDGPSNKRIKQDDDDSMFGFLTGTYNVSAPEISTQWSYARNGLNLVISLDSEKRLFGSFYFGICSGVLRSTDDIEPRADGASAKFEWCGREEYGGDEVYPPTAGMKGVLRFTRRKRDGRHTIKGVMEDVRALGKCEFTAEKVDDGTPIYDKWDDFDEDAYERANKGRWR